MKLCRYPISYQTSHYSCTTYLHGLLTSSYSVGYHLLLSCVIICYYQINLLLIDDQIVETGSCILLSSISKHLLAFWHKILHVYLRFPLTPPCNQPFLQGSLVPFTGKWYLKAKTQGLGVLIAFGISCFQVISVERTRKNIYTYMCKCAYVCIYII